MTQVISELAKDKIERRNLKLEKLFCAKFG